VGTWDLLSLSARLAGCRPQRVAVVCSIRCLCLMPITSHVLPPHSIACAAACAVVVWCSVPQGWFLLVGMLWVLCGLHKGACIEATLIVRM
jgi:hypothetical protein